MGPKLLVVLYREIIVPQSFFVFTGKRNASVVEVLNTLVNLPVFHNSLLFLHQRWRHLNGSLTMGFLLPQDPPLMFTEDYQV